MKRNTLTLYNLFPRYYTSMKDWAKEFKHIQKMGFNAVYINPIHYTGFSGSLYAPKDYFCINPIFVDTSDSQSPIEQFQKLINTAHEHHLLVIMDLVVNHSAKDHPFTTEHKDWYVSDKNNRVVSPGAWEDGQWVSWGDLAQFDHFESPDRQNMWEYLASIVSFYTRLGVDGYRADAAYQVPQDFWNFIIKKAKDINSKTLFLAESLGGRPEDSKNLSKAGFDFLFNSGKWWDFQAPWFVDQYNALTPAKSICFAESHDTIRIAQESQGDIGFLKQRLGFTGLISASWMIITGTEYGWLKKTDVIQTSPSDQEEINIDLSAFVTKINQLRKEYPILNSEGTIAIKDHENKNNVVLVERSWYPSSEKICFIINKTTQEQKFHTLDIPAFFGIKNMPKEILSTLDNYGKYTPQHITLLPKECKVFYYE